MEAHFPRLFTVDEGNELLPNVRVLPGAVAVSVKLPLKIDDAAVGTATPFVEHAIVIG